jgi:hypothetical protein
MVILLIYFAFSGFARKLPAGFTQDPRHTGPAGKRPPAVLLRIAVISDPDH